MDFLLLIFREFRDALKRIKWKRVKPEKTSTFRLDLDAEFPEEIRKQYRDTVTMILFSEEIRKQYHRSYYTLKSYSGNAKQRRVARRVDLRKIRAVTRIL